MGGGGGASGAGCVGGRGEGAGGEGGESGNGEGEGGEGAARNPKNGALSVPAGSGGHGA